MFFRLWKLCCFGLLACSLALPALPQGNGKGKGHHKQEGDDDEGHGKKKGRHEFGPHDRELISSYYASENSNLPPGLAKRGGNLPPGLEKQLEPCPVELERQLPPLEAGYSRGIIGAHVVIYNRSTSVIVDIMKDVVR